MKIKENLELIGAIVLMCIVFWFGKSCGKQDIVKPDNTIITVTNYRDTIFPKDTIYEDKWHPSKVIHDTTWLPLPKDSVDCDRVFVYDDTIRRKEYEIYSKTHVQGKIRQMQIGVKLKVPLIIKDCTVVKKDSLIYKPYKYEVHGGIILGSKMLAPVAELTIDKSTYMLGYDPFNKQPIIGFKYRIFGWTPKKRKK